MKGEPFKINLMEEITMQKAINPRDSKNRVG